MEITELADKMVEDDIDFIKAIFQSCPEYGEFIANDRDKRNAFLNEVTGVEE